MLYSHGPDLCRDQDLRHALANCLEAVMGAIYLEKGIEEARRVFSTILFDEDEDLRHIWANCPKHPLQVQWIYMLHFEFKGFKYFPSKYFVSA